MKKLLSSILLVFCISVAGAQTPSEALFIKYGNKKGVTLFVTSPPTAGTGIQNSSISGVVKEMTVNAENEDGKKGSSKLYKKVKKDCKKLFKSKDYVVVQQDKDDIESFTVFKYAKNGVFEMCVLTISEGQLMLESTQMTGLSEKTLANSKIDIKRAKM